jgi:lipopolysaccharide/colanic/teichoic acid biosynthesis glycosyltransferase
LVILIAIALDSPGPVFYRQHRLGRSFHEFDVLKFRTMVANAEAILEEHLQHDGEARAAYERFHKLENDPRITRVGRWLRKFSLDELPQLINVLKGEMSLAGPRAYMPSELDAMKEFAQVILRVKPGMTGWWQVSGRHRTTFQRRLELDDYYISNWSLWMDMFIFLKTGWVVLRGQGA